MVITPSRMFGLNITRLESIYNFHTPRYDFIITGNSDIVYRLIWKQLSASDGGWDVVTLAQVPIESRTLPEIDSLARAEGWSTGQWESPPSPFIRLNCSFETFFNRLKGPYRYNLRKRYEKLCKLGTVDVEVISDKNHVRDVMQQDGLRIEAAAWKGREGTAINSDANVTEFYIRMAERAAELEWLRLTFLRLNGKRIAFDYILRHKQSLYGVKIGYDPTYHTYSPGNMLLNLILQDACGEGMMEYDFLGVNDEWKFDWTKETRSHQWLFIFRDTIRGRLLYRTKFQILPKLRSLFPNRTNSS
jgi:CelD/BcsL family acetyltransferase involved in cellulose biosynthesis